MMRMLIVCCLILVGSPTRAQPSIIWQDCFGGTDSEQGIFVRETSDHGFIVAASTSSNNGDITNNHGSDDAILIRFDSNNNLVWKKNYGGSLDEGFLSILETSDHGFIAAGSTESNDGDVSGNHGSNDIWIVKVDSIGNLVWQKAFGGSDYDEVFSILENSAGNFVISGYTQSNDGDVSLNQGLEDFWLLEINSTGNIIWQKTYGGSDTDWGYKVLQTAEGGYLVSG